MNFRRYGALGLLLLIAALYCLAVGLHLSPAYIDLGDGNYLYTSSRMADGLMIYRDFLSPQPPMHLLTGSLLIRLGRVLGNPLMTVRVFSMVIHLITMGLIFLLGWRLTRSQYGGVLAALIYMVLPIGFWWSMGYQSELLEIVWLLVALLWLLPHRRHGAAFAGVFMALAVLTNMTAAPYALSIGLYLAIRHPKRLFFWYIVPLFLLVAVVALWFEVRTGAYMQNVFWNQIGSYPRENLWPYIWHKLMSQGFKVLYREGGYILLSLLGLILYNRHETRQEREFLCWYALILLLSIVFVTKGGTADYIFSLGEPMVALFAAYFLFWLVQRLREYRLPQKPFWLDTSPVVVTLFGLLLAVAISAPGFYFISETLRQKSYEQSESSLRQVTYYIERFSEPGDRILAPPYYAFITERLLVEEFSELYLWSLKYSLEQIDGVEGEATLMMRRIAERLETGEIPVVVANVSPANPMILRPEGIRQAIATRYRPLLDEPIRTLNTETQIFVPLQEP